MQPILTTLDFKDNLTTKVTHKVTYWLCLLFVALLLLLISKGVWTFLDIPKERVLILEKLKYIPCILISARLVILARLLTVLKSTNTITKTGEVFNVTQEGATITFTDQNKRSLVLISRGLHLLASDPPLEALQQHFKGKTITITLTKDSNIPLSVQTK